MRKNGCRACGKRKFKEVIDMGKQPLVNSLLTEKELGTEKVYPLKVEQCQDCNLVQVVDNISGQQIYRDVDYLYFSSDMPNLDAYFKDFATEISERFLKDGDFVLEIGSNDGIMLRQFKDMEVLGVDPATHVVTRAVAGRIPTISDFFTERLAKSISLWWSKAKVIYGANCIAHLDNLNDLLKGVTHLLDDDGVFIVECNYWGGMVKNLNWGLIYHDHFSYFTASDWDYLAKKHGLTLFDATVTPAQGGSLRVYLSKNERPRNERLVQLLEEEKESNLCSYETCKRYREEVLKKAKSIQERVKELKKEGKKIAGYGAAAKGFSILSLAGITDEIDYFVDDSPAKQGKYSPVTHREVISRSEAEKRGLPDYFFITAPNYAQVIIEKEKSKGYKGEFITP
jgi:SAM-dependent methyltransferase